MAAFVLKVLGMGLLISVAHQLLVKSGRDEQAMLLTLAGIVAVLTIVIDEIAALFQEIESLFGL